MFKKCNYEIKEINKLCDYGCGQFAHYQFKNGKYCCSKNCSSCPAVRKKNGELNRGKNHWKYNLECHKSHYCIDCNKEIGYRAIRCGNCANKGENNPRYGKHFSFETKQKISKVHKGKKLTREHKQKLSKATKGRKLSKKWKQKIGEAMKGRKRMPFSKETKQKMSKIKKNHWQNGDYDDRSICYPNIKYKKKEGNIIYLDSSWELEIAKSLDENDIRWLRPTVKNGHSFRWVDENGNQHTYFPDFYLLNYNIYLDPKNPFVQKKDKGKIEKVQKQNNIKLMILGENELNWKYIKKLL